MAPTMTTHNAGRRTATTRGGRTGGQAGRGGKRSGEQAGRVGGQTGDQGRRGNEANGGVDEVPDFSTVIAQQLQGLLPTIIAQVGDHISNQWINGSRNDNATDDNIQEDDRNANLGNDRNGCSCKDFVACKPKEFNGKGGTVAYIRMISVVVETTRRGWKRSSRVTLWLELVMHHTLIDSMNLLAPRQGGNRPNQAMAIEGGQCRGTNGNSARGRAFVMGSEEARQDPNIVTGTFSLNNHYATMLFDTGADYRFVSTTFVPLLDIEPSS
ncbi:hypothetical protein Tco_1035519 [Tanacetum coccineum]